VLDKYFPVLDYGFVALKEIMGDDSTIEESARVSYGKGTRKVSDTRNLLRYLMRHKHTTPYEMVTLRFHMSMPIHCHRQHIRHRMSSTNEFSSRYSEVPELMYEDYKLNLQSTNNKQGRSNDELDIVQSGWIKSQIEGNSEFAFNLYNQCIKGGVAREIARMHLPLNTYTYFYWKIDLHNLFHYLKLRCDSHAQYEIRQYANTMAGIVKAVCPLAFEAWYDYSFQAVNFTRLDRVLQQRISVYKEDEQYATINKNNESLVKISQEIGMSSREFDEFWHKLSVPDPQSFDLDMSTAKEPSFFESQKGE
jgi:thymidylate synthase (FAD)